METIIIQDTDEQILEVLMLALELENFKVFPLHGCDANFIELIEKNRPQVMMLDFQIDGKKSIEILRTIKEKYPNLPVIAMSCNNNINKLAYASGFDGYIEKPFVFDLLYSILRKHIATPGERKRD
ncbi:DNA-binding NtrC family response regulator [Flavobacterium sp. W4I14]|nr:DNA-binding NtrC family response regulator [Flavobacterium sp. W4I14]